MTEYKQLICPSDHKELGQLCALCYCLALHPFPLMQISAEASARASANEGASQKLREAEGQVQALSDSTTELRSALERLRLEAEMKEHRMKEVRLS